MVRAACWAASPIQTELHQIGIECRDGPFERAGQRVHRLEPGPRDAISRFGVLEPRPNPNGQLARIGDHLGATRCVERSIDHCEIPHMGAVHNGRAELGRFDRILSPCSTSEPPMNTIGAIR